MSADERLKELGWVKVKEDDKYITYEFKESGVIKKIVFCLEQQSIELSSKGTLEDFIRLKRADLRAFYKKMVELCWEK